MLLVFKCHRFPVLHYHYGIKTAENYDHILCHYNHSAKDLRELQNKSMHHWSSKPPLLLISVFLTPNVAVLQSVLSRWWIHYTCVPAYFPSRSGAQRPIKWPGSWGGLFDCLLCVRADRMFVLAALCFGWWTVSVDGERRGGHQWTFLTLTPLTPKELSTIGWHMYLN